MKKFATWCLNHLGLLLGIVTFTVTFAVIGVTMLNSHNAYLEYEQKFNEADLEIRSVSPAQAQSIEFNDDFRSTYKNELSLGIDDLVVETSQEDYLPGDYIDLTEKGGSVSAKLELNEKSFVDIDFVISSEYEQEDEEEGTIYGVKDLLNNVTFIVNGETMEEDEIDLENSGSGVEFHHLIMAGFALPEGEVSVEIKSNSGKNALMPQLQGINFYSSAALSLVEVTE